MQKFFCDNCGTQVDKNALRCPNCGRYFKSVKCPNCGLAGTPDLFLNGCPSCGYAEEHLNEGIDYFDIEIGRSKNSGRKRRRRPGKNPGPFSERFYKRILPLLVILFIVLIILLIRTGW